MALVLSHSSKVLLKIVLERIRAKTETEIAALHKQDLAEEEESEAGY